MPDVALTPTDYNVLYGMLRSPDEAVRGQAQSLAAKLTPEEQQTFFTFQRGVSAPTTERTDTSMVGVDRAALAKQIGDWMPSLPETWRGRAASLLASLVEGATAPESIAAIGAKPITAAMDAVGSTARSVGETVGGTISAEAKAVLRRIGMDPDEIERQIARTDLQTTRLRLQTAKARTRISDAQAVAAPKSAPTSPAGTAPAAAAPVAPPATAPVSGSAPPASPATAGMPEPVLAVAKRMKVAGYSDAEIRQSIQDLQKGVPPAIVEARIQAARALQQGSSPFAHLPDDLDVARSVADRNATGKWPE